MLQKDVEIMVRLKYLSNFGRILEMFLINCEINISLRWSKNFILIAGTVANQNSSFQINDANFTFLF